MPETGYAAIAATVLSLIFFYVPGAKDWYEKLEPQRKQWVMVGLLFAAVGGRFGLSCLGRDSAFVCDANGGYEAAVTFFIAVAVNAGFYNGIKYIADPGKRAIAKAEARVEEKVEARMELAEDIKEAREKMEEVKKIEDKKQ